MEPRRFTDEDLQIIEKKRHRSPNYPALGLREAVERTKKLYLADGKAGVPNDKAAQHIGFSSANGSAFSALSALKKFGLIESSSGRTVPTQRAIEIAVLPESDPRRLQALRDAALSPSIYKELIRKYCQTGPPPNDLIERELVTYNGFNPKAVEGFVKNFLDSLDFAGLTELSVLASVAMRDSDPVRADSNMAKAASFQLVPDAPPAANPADPIVRKYNLEISIHRNVRAELSIIGSDLRPEDLERLMRQLERLIENLSDAFKD
jgi:hypothetical protein